MSVETLGIALITLIGVAIIGFVVHVSWRVPVLSAARRRAVLGGKISSQSAAGPTMPTGVAVDWGLVGGAATLAVFDDDTIILYLYPRAAVAGSSRIRRLDDLVALGDELRQELRRLAHRFSRAERFPLPQPGELTFHLMDRTGAQMAGPMTVDGGQTSNPEFGVAERLATRLLARVCGTVPAVVPRSVMSLAIDDPSR